MKISIEVEMRKERRRAKTQVWRDRAGKAKPIDGIAFISGVEFGVIKRLYVYNADEKTAEGGDA